MTPKEKAKELFEKIIKCDKIDSYSFIGNQVAKQCALIAVNEMIIQNGELYLICVSDEKLLNHYRFTNSFLFQVKEEIEKL